MEQAHATPADRAQLFGFYASWEAEVRRRWYEDIVKQIDREDGLVHQRLSWMGQVEAFLFAGVALLAKDAKDLPGRVLLVGGGVVGIAVAIYCYRGVREAYKVIKARKDEFLAVRGKREDFFVQPFGGPPTGIDWGMLFGEALPALVGGLWLAVFFAALLQVCECGKPSPTSDGQDAGVSLDAAVSTDARADQ